MNLKFLSKSKPRDRQTDGVQHFICPIQVYLGGDNVQLAAGASRSAETASCNVCYFGDILNANCAKREIPCSRNNHCKPPSTMLGKRRSSAYNLIDIFDLIK